MTATEDKAMPKLLKEFPVGDKNQSKWDEWLDGKPREFVKGTDFDSSTYVFANCARNAAFTRRIMFRVKVRGDSVFVQAPVDS